MTIVTPDMPTHSNQLISTHGRKAVRIENPVDKLQLHTKVELIRLCNAHYEEVCGFITNQEHIFIVDNVHDEPKHNYYMERESCQNVVDQIHAIGERIIGIFHTHPNNQPWPSPRDLVGWPDQVLGWRYWIATRKELIEWGLVEPRTSTKG